MAFLEEESLDWALKHCQDSSLNFVPVSFEYEEFNNDWVKIKRILRSQNVSNWSARPLRKFIVPKASVGHRIITELDPMDHIIYSAIIYEIGKDIENNRPAKEKMNVFSYRYKPNVNGDLYDPDFHYIKFLEHSQELAQSGDYSYVATTDITDFYHNIYEHRLDNNLRQFTDKNSHVDAIIKLLKQWNEKNSRGIPVGPISSRLLAESLLIDIDNLLLMEGIIYCRWNDDFRIFANSYEEAYSNLYKLSSYLINNHNLTLQTSKTEILPSQDFVDKYIFPEERKQILEVREELYDSGIFFDPYSDTSYEYTEEELDEMELSQLCELLTNQANTWEPNFKLMKFLMNRLLIFNETRPILDLIQNLDTLYPIIFEIMHYVIHLDIDHHQKRIIGEELIKIYSNPIIQTLDYVRLWILHYFALNPSMINSNRLVKIYSKETDDIKREITYIMGIKGEFGWVRSKKGEWNNLSPWLQRAYLKSTNCLPDDEKRSFHDSIRGRMDPIYKCILS